MLLKTQRDAWVWAILEAFVRAALYKVSAAVRDGNWVCGISIKVSTAVGSITFWSKLFKTSPIKSSFTILMWCNDVLIDFLLNKDKLIKITETMIFILEMAANTRPEQRHYQLTCLHRKGKSHGVPPTKSYRPLMAAKEGELASPVHEHPDGLANTKWSALKAYIHQL